MIGRDSKAQRVTNSNGYINQSKNGTLESPHNHNSPYQLSTSNERILALKQKSDLEIPNLKNRLKNKNMLNSYIFESQKGKRYCNNNQIQQYPQDENTLQTKSKRHPLNITERGHTPEILSKEYNQMNTLGEPGRRQRVKHISIPNSKEEIAVKLDADKYKTPQNTIKNNSFDRESDATTKETNQYKGMGLISQSIDRLRMRKRVLENQVRSNPVDRRENRSTMRATGKFSN